VLFAVYRRYTLDEVKRKIVDALQGAGNTGMSGIELADRTGINRMTITKYLDIMHAMGLIKKKKVGTVNVWFVEPGVAGLEFPVNYTQVQQRLLEYALAGEEEQARRLLVSVINSSADQVKILTDAILPAANTAGELYSRGRIGKTERLHLATLMGELVDLVKFNARPPAAASPVVMDAHVVCLAGTGDMVMSAKSAAVAFGITGWDARYVGNVEQEIDPFFDIDLQRYLARAWGGKRGLMVVCAFSSEEGALKFLTSTARAMRGRLKGELRVVAFTPPGGSARAMTAAAEEGAGAASDYAATDIRSLLDWCERQRASISRGV
jgi:methanogenic corrinoid protein MtbC1